MRKTENNVVKSRYCNRINEGYEFINDGNDMIFTLKRCVSTLNYQTYTCYVSRISIKRGDTWIKTNELKAYNAIGDFIEVLKRTPNFLKATKDFQELNT